MTLILVFFWVASLAGVAWILYRGGVSPGARGLAAAVVLAAPAAALYALRVPATDRVADFAAFTLPAFLASLVSARRLIAGDEETPSRGARISILATGSLLLLISAAGRLSFLDAQLILAAGAVVLWMMDHGGREGRSAAAASPLALAAVALIAGMAAAVLVVDSMGRGGDALAARWALPCAIAVIAAFLPRLRVGSPSDACAVLTLSSCVIALGAAPIIALVRTALWNISTLSPDGWMQTMEVVSLSAAGAPRLAGLARLTPEAALLTATGAALVLIGPRSKGRAAVGAILVAAGAAILASRALRLPGIAVF